MPIAASTLKGWIVRRKAVKGVSVGGVLEFVVRRSAHYDGKRTASIQEYQAMLGRRRRRGSSGRDQKFTEEQKQILRLTTPNLHPSGEDLSLGTPKLKSVWGPVRSG